MPLSTNAQDVDVSNPKVVAYEKEIRLNGYIEKRKTKDKTGKAIDIYVLKLSTPIAVTKNTSKKNTAQKDIKEVMLKSADPEIKENIRKLKGIFVSGWGNLSNRGIANSPPALVFELRNLVAPH